ncbi:hypothetical protein [Dapis sp. BLCC M172]
MSLVSPARRDGYRHLVSPQINEVSLLKAILYLSEIILRLK